VCCVSLKNSSGFLWVSGLETLCFCMQTEDGIEPRHLLDVSKRVIAVENVRIQFLRLLVGLPSSSS